MDALLDLNNANTFRHILYVIFHIKNIVARHTACSFSMSLAFLYIILCDFYSIYVPIFTFNCSSIRTSRVLSAMLDP